MRHDIGIGAVYLWRDEHQMEPARELRGEVETTLAGCLRPGVRGVGGSSDLRLYRLVEQREGPPRHRGQKARQSGGKMRRAAWLIPVRAAA